MNKKLALLTCLILASFPAMAEIMPCEKLKAEIDGKLQAKGIKSYTLEIVASDSAANPSTEASDTSASSKGKVVGTCDGGTKKIIYTRN